MPRLKSASCVLQFLFKVGCAVACLWLLFVAGVAVYNGQPVSMFVFLAALGCALVVQGSSIASVLRLCIRGKYPHLQRRNEKQPEEARQEKAISARAA